MTNVEKALFSAWIRRLGKKRVVELTASIAGSSLGEKVAKLVKSKSNVELAAILLEGFDGYYHQTVYMRRIKQADKLAKAIDLMDSTDGVSLLTTLPDGKLFRALFMVTQRMQFVESQTTTVFSIDVAFPVALSISGPQLTIQVLTMQSGRKTWSLIVGRPLQRMLTFVRADRIADKLLTFLLTAQVDLGEYHDYTGRAKLLLASSSADTYSGSYNEGTDGQSTHKTVRGKGKRALRESMPNGFEKLMGANRILKAEVELKDSYQGLDAGSKMVVYPSIGKIILRSSLEGGDLNAFIKALGKDLAMAG